MSVRNREQKTIDEHKRPKNILWLIIVILVIFISCTLAWRFAFYKSPREQLAAIEAANAIPDSENAAILYLQILEDYNKTDTSAFKIPPTLEKAAKEGPWLSKDDIELAGWLKQFQQIIENLIHASRLEKCRFPISISSADDFTILTPRWSIHKLGLILLGTANNDLAEGRIEQTLEKYICCIHIGRHYRQLPLDLDFIFGMLLEDLSMQQIRHLIMSDNLTEEQIKTIETALPQSDEQWNNDWEMVCHIEKLVRRLAPPTLISTGWLNKFRELWYYRTVDIKPNRKREYLKLLADRRGSQILVALRQYKNKNGNWPEKLAEIKPFLIDEDILIDPQNKGSFVYKLKDNGFILYSIGLNKIDENGQKKDPADDRQIWPLQAPQTQTQNTNATQNDPSME